MTRSQRKTLRLMLMIGGLSGAAWAQPTMPWHRNLEVAQVGRVQVRLQDSAAREAGRGTLELLDPAGSSVVFELGTERDDDWPVQLASITERNDGWWLVFDLGSSTPRHRQLNFVPARLTSAEVILEASPDGSQWRELHRGELFRLGEAAGLSQHALAYEAIGDRFLRLFWPRSAELPTIKSITVQAESQGLTATPLALQCTQIMEAQDCELEVQHSCREIAVSLATPDRPFGARVWQARAGRWVPRFETAGQRRTIRWPALPGLWRLRVEGPAAVGKPTATCRATGPVLSFEAEKIGAYQLRYSGPRSGQPGSLSRLAVAEPGTPVHWVIAGPEVPETWPTWPTVATTAAALPKTLFAATWQVDLPEALPGTTTRLVVPDEVTAASRHDLADLRLEQGGFQVPYVVIELERPHVLRAKRERPQKAGTSSEVVWEFSPPLPATPSARELAIRAPGPFERTLEVSTSWAPAPDGPRNLHGQERRILGPTGSWSCKRLDALTCEQRVSVSGKLADLRLLVQDDQDVALPWIDLELTASQKALLFVAPQADSPLLLHVGAELAAPDYDLEAQLEILEARPWSEAKLGARISTVQPDGLPRWLLPLVIGLAALLLIYLLVRLVGLGHPT